jgi:serine/threonine protein kinase
MGADIVIGPFLLGRSLGQGSTGEVFLAERTQPFPQRVAIKVLAGSGFEDRDGGAHEADVLVALDHPYIVKLIDRGMLPDGRRFIVMEYVDGEPIDVYCDRRALPTAERVRLLIKVMEALSYLHRHLIIHSDLKPPNILVTPRGEPKLLDFGVAQQRGLEGPTGYTPEFASPEQHAAGRLTAASDVYSLGVIACGLLGKNRGRDLEAILYAATRAEPTERYASIDAFKADLHCYLDGRDVSPRPSSRLNGWLRWTKRHRVITAATLVVVLTIVLAAVGVIRSATRAAQQRALARNQLHELVALTGTLEGELYDSVGHLPQSNNAREVLLRGARETLATLAARDAHDSLLTLELARQYSRLSQLQWDGASEAGDPAAAKRAARVDLDQGLRLLGRIDRRDSGYATAQRDLASMQHLPAALGR